MLTRCDPGCLTFMNSWGKEFADGGFFRVKDENVLNTTRFFDIYWDEKDLTQSEKAAYKRECTKRAKELSAEDPSIQELPYECPKCKRRSKVGYFNVLEAKCPICTNKALLNSHRRFHNNNNIVAPFFIFTFLIAVFCILFFNYVIFFLSLIIKYVAIISMIMCLSCISVVFP